MICNEVGAAKRLISESGSKFRDLILIKLGILLSKDSYLMKTCMFLEDEGFQVSHSSKPTLLSIIIFIQVIYIKPDGTSRLAYTERLEGRWMDTCGYTVACLMILQHCLSYRLVCDWKLPR